MIGYSPMVTLLAKLFLLPVIAHQDQSCDELITFCRDSNYLTIISPYPSSPCERQICSFWALINIFGISVPRAFLLQAR